MAANYDFPPQQVAYSWRDAFCHVYKSVKLFCSINDVEIAFEVGVSVDTVRQYTGARQSIPTNITPLCALFEKKANCLNAMSRRELLREVCKILNIEYTDIEDDQIGQFISAQLNKCHSNTKAKSPYPFLESKQEVFPSLGHIQAVVFDFDGTLTKTKSHTTWESIWTMLGYDVEECRKLHRRYDKDEFNHQTWCDMTAEKFIQRGLCRQQLIQLAKQIKLISGCTTTLQELRSRNIHMSVVSGSIKSVIQEVLGNAYCFFDDIKANEFKFNTESHLLERIIGTKYDFEGKADYIVNIANKLQISTADILFVGNSNNDVYAYKSGAKTLCINPMITDYHNDTVWNEYIVECKYLSEILTFIV